MYSIFTWPDSMDDLYSKIDQCLQVVSPQFIVQHGFTTPYGTDVRNYQIQIQSDYMYTINIVETSSNCKVVVRQNVETTLKEQYSTTLTNLSGFFFYVSDNMMGLNGAVAMELVQYSDETIKTAALFCTSTSTNNASSSIQNWNLLRFGVFKTDIFSYTTCIVQQDNPKRIVNKAYVIIVDNFTSKNVLGIYNNAQGLKTGMTYMLTDIKSKDAYKAMCICWCFDLLDTTPETV